MKAFEALRVKMQLYIGSLEEPITMVRTLKYYPASTIEKNMDVSLNGVDGGYFSFSCSGSGSWRPFVPRVVHRKREREAREKVKKRFRFTFWFGFSPSSTGTHTRESRERKESALVKLNSVFERISPKIHTRESGSSS